MASIVKWLRILLLLQQEELSVAELQEILGTGQSRTSAHLAQLKAAKLAQDRRAGKNIYYAIARANPIHKHVEEIVQASAKEIPEAARDRVALRLALRKRQDKAREYFNKLAGKFGRSHCPGRSWKGVAHMLLALVGPITVADLGAGEGILAQLLARRAKKVIAVDNSEKMVEFGAALAKEHGFENLEYRLGDIESPPISGSSVDLALLSQALHHASNPARAVAAAHRILKKGGRIAILDLLTHNFEKARELYADMWLGFSEVELHQLLKASGFQRIEIDVVAREEQSPNLQTLFATAVK
jgi:ubiquinone/menaquinone biosynthesis C-methylase UbiE